MNELKPCPFCGETPFISGSLGRYKLFHKCDVIQTCIGVKNSKKELTDSWNTRTQREWISDERLKELCESYAKYCRLAAILCEAPNYQNWLIKQGLSNPLAQPNEQCQ